MTNSTRRSTLALCDSTTFAMSLICALTMLAMQSAQAQTYHLLHNFTDGSDGANPNAGVTVGGTGTLYGTTAIGGTSGHGTVYKLVQKGSGWTLDPLYEFTGGSDGDTPLAGLAIGRNGAFYGTTSAGGSSGGGTVFEVRPPGTACKSAICYWNETVIHSFAGSPNDGSDPDFGNLVFDTDGNLYGTTFNGGANAFGTAYELTPESGDNWTETILYSFTNGADGGNPFSGVILDSSGNLYGNNSSAGALFEGVVYQLMPAGPPWTENTLANFSGGSTGSPPLSTLIMDGSRNLYGTGEGLGPEGGGTVYEVSPSNGSWIFSLAYAFGLNPSCFPSAGVTLGPDGNLYGVCAKGGANNDGWVFEMLTTCNQTCSPRDLYDFTGPKPCLALGSVTFDSNGNLYGTCYGGGNPGCVSNAGCGSVWELEGVINRRESILQNGAIPAASRTLPGVHGGVVWKITR